MEKLPEQVIVDILKTEMGLTDTAVWIRDQNFKIPPGDGLFITVGTVDSIPMSTQTLMETQPVPDSDPVEYEQVEINRVQMRQNIQIDLFSRSNAAIMKKWEVMAALVSIYSQQQQEAFTFKIGRFPTSFVNSSDAEGGSQLNRFSLIFPCFVWYKKSKSLAPNSEKYYDDFSTRVDDAQSIATAEGLIEFNIKGENIT